VDTPEESDDSDKQKIPLPPIKGEVKFEDLCFSFNPAAPQVLRHIDLVIPAGTFVGVVGQSGSGKSTLTKMLPRLYDPTSGRILIDGFDIDKVELYSLRRQIGMVPQEPLLFSGSVAENIARFQKIDSEAILKAATLAGCHAMIQQMPDGYNTQIGDGGQSLSGGQRQRIGLARALYGTPSLIVLDEPNASLDSAGEEALLEALKAMRAEGVTLIIITHKINALAVADRILVLADGQVKSFGPRDEVLGKLVAPRVVQGQPDQTNPSTIRQG
jgi:ATP-binding cassette subfamily B protein